MVAGPAIGRRMQKHSGIHILRSERPRKRKGGRRAHSKKQHISQQLHIGLEPSLAGHQSSRKCSMAFSLLVYTKQPLLWRLFLKKRRTSLHSPVQSRSENAI
jgi:hypothetical protein